MLEKKLTSTILITLRFLLLFHALSALMVVHVIPEKRLRVDVDGLRVESRLRHRRVRLLQCSRHRGRGHGRRRDGRRSRRRRGRDRRRWRGIVAVRVRLVQILDAFVKIVLWKKLEA